MFRRIYARGETLHRFISCRGPAVAHIAASATSNIYPCSNSYDGTNFDDDFLYLPHDHLYFSHDHLHHPYSDNDHDDHDHCRNHPKLFHDSSPFLHISSTSCHNSFSRSGSTVSLQQTAFTVQR